MSYPAIKRKDAQTIAAEIRSAMQEGKNPLDVASEDGSDGIEVRSGPDYDRTAVENFAATSREKFLQDTSDTKLSKIGKKRATRLEAEMAGYMHNALSPLGVAILQDPDFWRYLALYPLRWYLIAREPEIQPQDFGGFVERLDEDGRVRLSSPDMKRQVILRTYLWGKCARSVTDPPRHGDVESLYRRATQIKEAPKDEAPPKGEGLSPIDVWHSHMVRVQMGQLGAIPNAFIDVIAGPEKASTNDARELEKLVTRMKHNVLLDRYGLDDATVLVKSQLPEAKNRAAAKEAADNGQGSGS